MRVRPLDLLRALAVLLVLGRHTPPPEPGVVAPLRVTVLSLALPAGDGAPRAPWRAERALARVGADSYCDLPLAHAGVPLADADDRRRRPVRARRADGQVRAAQRDLPRDLRGRRDHRGLPGGATGAGAARLAVPLPLGRASDRACVSGRFKRGAVTYLRALRLPGVSQLPHRDRRQSCALARATHDPRVPPRSCYAVLRETPLRTLRGQASGVLRIR